MSNLEETLTMQSLETILTLSKIYEDLMKDSMISELIGMFVPSKM